MFIPGALISAMTFPGVVVHEWAHQMFCRFFRVPVYQVCYFRFGNPAGFVVHGRTEKWGHGVLIGMGPFFLNTLLGAAIAFPSSLRVFDLDGFPTVVDAVLVWLGVSIAMHAVPSTGDAKSMWKAVSADRAPFGARLLVVPLVGIIYLLALGSIFWLDLVYGICVSLALPKLLVMAMA